MKEIYIYIFMLILLNIIVDAQRIEIIKNQEFDYFNSKNNEEVTVGTQTDKPKVENNITNENVEEEEKEKDSLEEDSVELSKGKEENIEENKEEKEETENDHFSCNDPEFKHSPPCIQPKQNENELSNEDHQNFESNEIPKPQYPYNTEIEEEEENNKKKEEIKTEKNKLKNNELEVNEEKEEIKNEENKNIKIIPIGINANNTTTVKGEEEHKSFKKPAGFWQSITCLLINFNCPTRKENENKIIENKEPSKPRGVRIQSEINLINEDELGSLEKKYELSGEENNLWNGKLNDDENIKQFNSTMKFGATFIKSEIDEFGKQHSNITHFNALMHN